METDTSESTGLVSVLAWVEVNKKRIIIGSAAALVFLLLAFLFVQHQAQKEDLASQALSDVRVPFSAAVAPAPGTADALLKVAEEHQGTKAASRALLLSAGLLFAENTPSSYSEAQKRFTRVLQEYPSSPWTAEASVGLAASLAALGKTNEATAKYEEIRKRFASSPVIDDAKLALARLYENQKPEEALKLYDELAKAGMTGMAGGGMGSGSAMEANMRMDDLVKKHPELAKLKESLSPAPTPAPQTFNLGNPLTNRMATASNAVRTVVSNATSRLATNANPIKLTTPQAVAPK